jgi:3-oxoacyl-(acyl-carrier-protein) synthase
MIKIAVTGFGIVAPSGVDKKAFWANMKAGRSAIKKIERYDASLTLIRTSHRVFCRRLILFPTWRLLRPSWP